MDDSFSSFFFDMRMKTDKEQEIWQNRKRTKSAEQEQEQTRRRTMQNFLFFLNRNVKTQE